MSVPSSPHPPGVLVVDDDPSLLIFLYTALRDHNLTVWGAANGEQAVKAYRENQQSIRAVLLGERIPGMGGRATLSVLRQVNPSVPCCVVANRAGKADTAELLRLGAAEVLHKPFGFNRLVQVLLRLAVPPADPAE